MARLHMHISADTSSALNHMRAKLAVARGDDPVNLNRTQFDHYMRVAGDEVRRIAMEEGVPLGEANSLVNRYRRDQERRWRRESKRMKESR